jgi:hypothetical protein
MSNKNDFPALLRVYCSKDRDGVVDIVLSRMHQDKLGGESSPYSTRKLQAVVIQIKFGESFDKKVQRRLTSQKQQSKSAYQYVELNKQRCWTCCRVTVADKRKSRDTIGVPDSAPLRFRWMTGEGNCCQSGRITLIYWTIAFSSEQSSLTCAARQAVPAYVGKDSTDLIE